MLPAQNPQIDPTNNRYTTGQGYDYDAAGNLTSAPSYTYTYDAENRITSANTGLSFGRSDYGYDSDGRRVKKVTGSGATTTVFVYNASGQLVAEYGGQAQKGAGGTSYVTQDMLGSTRAVTDGVGRSNHSALKVQRFEQD